MCLKEDMCGKEDLYANRQGNALKTPAERRLQELKINYFASFLSIRLVTIL